MSEHLVNIARISIPEGWLVVSDAPYSIADGTLAQLDLKMRNITASNELVAGEYTVAAVAGNESFPFNVRVKGGDSQGDCFAAVRALQRALQQRSFVLETTLGDWAATWNCFSADVSIQSDKPLLYAAQAVVSTTISALPQEA